MRPGAHGVPAVRPQRPGQMPGLPIDRSSAAHHCWLTVNGCNSSRLHFFSTGPPPALTPRLCCRAPSRPAAAGSTPQRPMTIPFLPWKAAGSLVAAGGTENSPQAPQVTLGQTTLQDFAAAVPPGAAAYFSLDNAVTLDMVILACSRFTALRVVVFAPNGVATWCVGEGRMKGFGEGLGLLVHAAGQGLLACQIAELRPASPPSVLLA